MQGRSCSHRADFVGDVGGCGLVGVAEAIAKGSNELAEQVLGTWTSVTKEVTEVIQSGHWDSGLAAEEVTRTVTESTYAASEYAKTGEKAIDTLTRLATSLSTVNGLNDAMGYKFEHSGLAGAAAASKIADAFGGLEAMAQSLGSYISNYYSESEQRATTARTVSKSLAEAGLDFGVDAILAATRPQIRTFVEGVRDEFGADSKQYVAAINAGLTLDGRLVVYMPQGAPA